MQLTFKIYSGPNQLFAENAFDGSVGTNIDVKGFGTGKVLKAEVVEKGRAVLFTIDTLEDVNFRKFQGGRGYYSVKDK